jgi:dsDNA-specific endonuclease/ATPase MutS2
MRIANSKTKSELGLDFVLHHINIQTPFGISLAKGIIPFVPGQEEDLRYEYEKINVFAKLLNNEGKILQELLRELMEVKATLFTIERSENNVLSMVELFEIKNLLLRMGKIKSIMESLVKQPLKEFQLEDTESLLDLLDPRGDRMNTFYIYNEFLKELGPLRDKKREIEIDIRKKNKKIKLELENKYKLMFTPKFECTIQKTDENAIKITSDIPEIISSYQDYMTITYIIKPTNEIYELTKEIDLINEKLDEVELEVRKSLSKEIGQNRETLISNCEKIGQIDFALAKASYAMEHKCVEPLIENEHIIEIVKGRQLEVEEILNKKGKEYCPVSINIKAGVTCITGANMGGKTVCLKLAGLVVLLAQYGFYVPCVSAKIGLASYIHILIGDSQSVQRGLSSFGSEMEELKEIIDNSKERAFVLIDEIASGTNPKEGLALTKAIIEYLSERPFISLITTHYDGVNNSKKAKNMQVTGLANADFKKLDKEIRYANRKERIEIVGKYMDYSLRELDKNEEVSKDAINIAKMLGINEEIINNAKKYI